jgi:transcriptional regulator NrdR family protein
MKNSWQPKIVNGEMRFVNKSGISTDQMREMINRYSSLNITQKNDIKEQLGCSKSMSELEFLTHVRVNSLHRSFMDLLGM